MPLSGGTAGAHDDAMHQGSAKRDVVNGVAGLDASGYILGIGPQLRMPVDGGGHLYFVDRTSGEAGFNLTRIGAGNFTLEMRESAAWVVVQTASMKDIVSGIAALDAGGAVLAPGSELKLTRDGSNNIELIERTSADIVARWTRTGVNDYQAYIHCGGLVCQFQHSGMKDIANGIAGLDANALLTPALLPPCLEEYSNHLGATDNFTATATAGNGAAAADAANHEMDLDSGNGVAGYALFRSKKQWTLGAKPIVVNMILNNISHGAGGTARIAFAGLKNDFTDQSVIRRYLHVGFELDNTGQWRAITSDNVSITETAVTIANGDLLTIVATSAKELFFVNGTLVVTHTTDIPTHALNLGAAVHTWDANASASMILSVDLMGIKVFS